MPLEDFPYSINAPFNSVYRMSSHNSYLPENAATLTEVIDACQSIELDIWDDDNAIFSTGAMDYNWYVRHEPTGGNSCNASPPGDFCACLLDIATYMDSHPGHSLITCFVEKKQGWGDTRYPSDFDSMLDSLIGSRRIYKPQDLMNRVQRAVASDSTCWPHESDLSGKLMIILHGGRWHGLGANEVLNEYVESTNCNGVAFVAPSALNEREVLVNPHGFSNESSAYVFFYNISNDALHLLPLIRNCGLLSKVWGAAVSSATYSNLIKSGANFIGIDNYMEQNWNNRRMKGITR